ncbi:MAG: hypothetical protein EBX52_01705 [Proteobacteria bacterium]|nr:hypothetical protein [Pseudomonadota bacterium]
MGRKRERSSGLVKVLFCALLGLSTLPAHSSTHSCDDLARNPLPHSSSETYNLLAREKPSQNQAARLFEETKSDPELRSKMNDAIEGDRVLVSMAEQGLDFREEVKTFLDQKMNPGFAGITEILDPVTGLQRNFEAFKRELISNRDVPMTEQQADRLALNDVQTRFGGAFGSSDLAGNYEARYYFNRQKQRYLQTDIRKPAADPKERLERYRSWLRSTLKDYAELRVQNLREGLIRILEYERFQFRVHATRPVKPSVPGDPTDSTIGFAEYWNASTLRSMDMSIIHGNPENIPVLELDLDPGAGLSWNNARLFFGFYHTRRGLELYGPMEEGRKSDLLLIHSTDPAFIENMKSRFQRWNLPVDGSGRFAIRLENLQGLFDRHIQRMGRTSITEANRLANELTLRLYRDQDLFKLQTALEIQLAKPDMTAFEKSIPGIIPDESNLLRKMRDLDRIEPRDPVTGVEWYGNKIHSTYWKNRDASVKSNVAESLPARVWNRVADRFLKLREITRNALVIGSIAGIGYLAYPKIEAFVNRDRHPVATTTVSTPIEVERPRPVVGLSGDFKPEPPRDRSEKAGQNPDANSAAPEIELYKVTTAKDTFYTLKPDASNFPKEGTEFDFNNDNQIVLRRGEIQNVPRFFDQASNLETSEMGKMKDITRIVTRFENRERRARDHGFAQTIGYSSSVDLVAKNRQLMLPRPEGGYALSFVEVQSYEHFNTPVIQAVRVHPQTGQYLIEVKPEFASDHFYCRAEFRRITGSRREAAREWSPPAIHDARIEALDHSKLLVVQKRLAEAGLLDLSRHFDSLLSSRNPVSADALADLISNTQIYSLSPGNAALPADSSGNPYFEFAQYLRHGQLFMKCDVANHLLQVMLKEVLEEHPDIHIDHFYSFIYTPERSALGSIGHARTLIRIDGVDSRKIIDATPSRSLDGTTVEQPWQHYTAPAEKRERDLAVKNPPPPAPPAPSKSRKPEPANDEKGAPPLQPWSVPPEKTKVRSERIGPEEIERMRRYREEWIRDLEQKADLLLHDPQFKPLVKNREALPPVRIYRLTRAALQLAKGEILLDSFLEKAKNLYPGEVPARIEDPGDLQAFFRGIRIKEEEFWTKMTTHFEKNRKSPFGFATQSRLKTSVMGLLDRLAAYSWEEPL